MDSRGEGGRGWVPRARKRDRKQQRHLKQWRESTSEGLKA